MFIPKTFDKTVNTVAFLQETFKKDNTPFRLRLAGREDVYTYCVKGIWVSTNSNTKGALVSGTVRFSFVGEQYADLNFGECMAFGRTEKNPQALYNERIIRNVDYGAEVLVGNGNVWAGRPAHMERSLMFLLETYFNLPAAPVGYTPWLTQKNKD